MSPIGNNPLPFCNATARATMTTGSITAMAARRAHKAEDRDAVVAQGTLAADAFIRAADQAHTAGMAYQIARQARLDAARMLGDTPRPGPDAMEANRAMRKAADYAFTKAGTLPKEPLLDVCQLNPLP